MQSHFGFVSVTFGWRIYNKGRSCVIQRLENEKKKEEKKCKKNVRSIFKVNMLAHLHNTTIEDEMTVRDKER